jgi:hypothetical protein
VGKVVSRAPRYLKQPLLSRLWRRRQDVLRYSRLGSAARTLCEGFCVLPSCMPRCAAARCYYYWLGSTIACCHCVWSQVDRTSSVGCLHCWRCQRDDISMPCSTVLVPMLPTPQIQLLIWVTQTPCWPRCWISWHSSCWLASCSPGPAAMCAAGPATGLCRLATASCLHSVWCTCTLAIATICIVDGACTACVVLVELPAVSACVATSLRPSASCWLAVV